MIPTRRALLSVGLSAGMTGALAVAAAATPREKPPVPAGLTPFEPQRDATGLHTASLQAAIDAAAVAVRPLVLAPGVFQAGTLTLRSGTRLIGSHGATTLEFAGGPSFVVARGGEEIRIEDLTLDGAGLALDPAAAGGLIDAEDCTNLHVRDLTVTRSLLNGVALRRVSGSISATTITRALLAGIHSIDARGLRIDGNEVTDCSNNGILVWRSEPGEDATLVTGNRIANIRAKAGGSGQNGNGINVYRAASVLVSHNRISDCAYSAVRGNAASNLQIIGNSCERLGEVALYAEFGFQGAVIANNVVDTAASGISVTNFNEGGRLAVVEGNLIRNLYRREHEPQDKRGEGIGVEADSLVSGNVIEGAPTAGITVGWGPHMRNCMITNNLIRDARTGIVVTSDPAAGACMITGNMLTGVRDGAVRVMSHGTPEGPDLALSSNAQGRISVSGNVVG